jgi:hypothetical protein
VTAFFFLPSGVGDGRRDLFGGLGEGVHLVLSSNIIAFFLIFGVRLGFLLRKGWLPVGAVDDHALQDGVACHRAKWCLRAAARGELLVAGVRRRPASTVKNMCTSAVEKVSGAAKVLGLNPPSGSKSWQLAEKRDMWGGLPWASWNNGDGNAVDRDDEETLP